MSEPTISAGGPILPEFTSVFIFTGVAVVALVFTVILSVLIVKIKQRKPRPKKALEGAEEPEKYTACGDDDNNPDVIPQSSGKYDQNRARALF